MVIYVPYPGWALGVVLKLAFYLKKKMVGGSYKLAEYASTILERVETRTVVKASRVLSL